MQQDHATYVNDGWLVFQASDGGEVRAIAEERRYGSSGLRGLHRVAEPLHPGGRRAPSAPRSRDQGRHPPQPVRLGAVMWWAILPLAAAASIGMLYLAWHQ